MFSRNTAQSSKVVALLSALAMVVALLATAAPAGAQDNPLEGLEEFGCEWTSVVENRPIRYVQPGQTFRGTPGRDIIVGTSGNDRIIGRSGDDVICGRGGNDTISGGDGDDRLLGGGGNDFLSGGAGGDHIFGRTGHDTIRGGDGSDTIGGDGGWDKLFGENGDDDITGEAGNDTIEGGSGNDDIIAGSGNDTVRGGTGNDRMDGGEGNDSLAGGSGTDRANGGPGIDTCKAERGLNGEPRPTNCEAANAQQSTSTQSQQPTSSGVRLAKHPNASDAHMIYPGQGVRRWVDASCLGQIYQAQLPVGSFQNWNTEVAIYSASNTKSCGEYKADLGGSSSNSPTPSQPSNPSTPSQPSGSVGEFAAVAGDNHEAWILMSDGTRHWINQSCRNQLTAALGAPRYVSYNAELRNRSDTPGSNRLSCGQLQAQL